MRRTLGDMGRFRLLAAAACAAVFFFVPGVAAPVCGLAGVAPAFDCAGLDGEGCGAEPESCPLFSGAAVGACLSGESAAAGLEDCCATTGKAEGMPVRSPHSRDSASTHHHLRPNRTTLFFV